MPVSIVRARLLFLALLAFLSPACSRNGDHKPVHPVRGQVLFDQVAAGVEAANPGNHLRIGCLECQSHGSERAGGQHIIAVQPGQDLAGGFGHSFVNGVALAAVCPTTGTVPSSTPMITNAPVDAAVTRNRPLIPTPPVS